MEHQYNECWCSYCNQEEYETDYYESEDSEDYESECEDYDAYELK